MRPEGIDRNVVLTDSVFFFLNEHLNDFNSNIHSHFYHTKEIANLVRICEGTYSGELLISKLGRLVQNRSRGDKTKTDENLMSSWLKAAHFNHMLQAILGRETEILRQQDGRRNISSKKASHEKRPQDRGQRAQNGVKWEENQNKTSSVLSMMLLLRASLCCGENTTNSCCEYDHSIFIGIYWCLYSCFSWQPPCC